MPPIRTVFSQGQPADIVRRIGAAVFRTPTERLTRALGIRYEDGLISLVDGTEQN